MGAYNIAKKSIPAEQVRERRTGKQIGIIASGPSCTKEDAETLKEACQEIIAVNDCYRLVEADHLWGTDARWWQHHISDVSRDFEGTCWTQDIDWDRIKADPVAWGIRTLRGDNRKPGLSTDPNIIHCGSNSGYAAINLALNLHHHTGRRACQRILLLGFDMGTAGNKRHWFGAHPAGMEFASNYRNFIKRFETIDCADYGIEIINVTRRTALNHFPRMTLEDAHDLWQRTATDRDGGADGRADHHGGSQVAHAGGHID